MVERNGLEHRGREQKFAFWTSLVIGFFFLSFFVAPFTIEKGTTGDLSGNANLFDYVSDDGGSWGSGGNQKAGPHEHEDGEIVEHSAFAWSELNIYAAIIYGFGDLNCHQKHERSWILNENQLPVCTRDIGIFFGLFLGSVAFYFRGINRWTVRDTCLSLYSDRWLNSIYLKNRRTLAWLLTGVVLCLPLIFDGFYQLLTEYESNNAVRIITGVPFGFGLGILFLGMYSARSQYFASASAVQLPGGVSFSLVKKEESD